MQLNWLWTVIAGAALLAWSAQSQDAEPSRDMPPLSGPTVENDRPSQLEQGLTVMPGMAPSVGQQMGGVRQLPPEDVADLLRQLGSADAREDLRLSAEQSEALKQVREAHQDRVREYRKEHAEQFRELREQAGYNVEPRVPDSEVDPDTMRARLELRALYNAGPTATDLQIRFFAVLTREQQRWIDAEFERLLNERRRARGEAQNRELLNRPEIDPETFFNDDGSVNMEAVPPRLRDRLKGVAEDRRADQLRRILDRLSQIQSAAERGSARSTDRQAPPLDSVIVPDPNDL